jgi:hypothetical protein
MARTTLSTFTQLKPVKLDYFNQPSNELNFQLLSYQNGLSLYDNTFLRNYQDVTINRGSCFILTNKTNIQNVFKPQTTQTLGTIPVSVFLAPRGNTTQFAFYRAREKRFTLGTGTSNRTPITISPTNDRDVVELVSNGRFLQTKDEYPYEVILNDYALYNTTATRQRFKVIRISNNLIALQTTTPEGERYLTFTRDGVLRATGATLNGVTPSNYILQCTFISRNSLSIGFSPIDYWVTYYNDSAQLNNANLALNQKIPITQNNFLIDFSANEATRTRIGKINVLTLKNNITPTELPAPLTNIYNPQLTN